MRKLRNYGVGMATAVLSVLVLFVSCRHAGGGGGGGGAVYTPASGSSGGGTPSSASATASYTSCDSAGTKVLYTAGAAVSSDSAAAVAGSGIAPGSAGDPFNGTRWPLNRSSRFDSALQNGFFSVLDFYHCVLYNGIMKYPFLTLDDGTEIMELLLCIRLF